jgi:hypothetical protein
MDVRFDGSFGVGFAIEDRSVADAETRSAE